MHLFWLNPDVSLTVKHYSMISVFFILVAVMYQQKEEMLSVGPSKPEIIGLPVMVGL